MDRFYEIGLEIVRWLQTTYPTITPVMKGVSLIGQFSTSVFPLFLIMYWCFDKKVAEKWGYMAVLAIALDHLLKHWLHTPRPFWLDPSVGLAEELSYGVPSGHVLIAVVVAFFWLGRIRQGWAWTLALVYVSMMGFSRVYLGVHFFQDVLAGGLLGILCLIGYVIWESVGNSRYQRLILGQRLLLAIAVPVIIGIIYGVGLLIFGKPSPQVKWASFIDSAEYEGYTTVTQTLALLLGLGIGNLFQKSRVYFETGGDWKIRLLRFVVGLAGVLLFWGGLGAVFDAITPPNTLWLAVPLEAIRHIALGLWVAYYAPLLFVTLKLAHQSAEPEWVYSVSGVKGNRTH